MEVSLREYLETLINKLCEKMSIRIEALNESISVAKREMDRRLEGMNEFRTQLTRQAGEFIGKTEFKLEIDKLEIRLKVLEECLATSKGSSKWSDHIITVIIAAGVVLLLRVIKF